VRVGGVPHLVGIVAVAVVAVGPAVFHGDAVLVCAWLGVALGEVAVVTTAWGVRQWRFAPGPRRRALAALLVAGATLVVAVPPIATSGVPVAAPALAALLLGVTAVLARVPARLLAESTRR
jgi:hypothetical protein